ncbi:PEGA domain-containing protein [Pyxidicoccus xibeiensis]|uniref:PEGA domain-containing protein n=1 Tax=Pyxidicoccus xibeiensis TaxID=2906759 RepID=UPI0020A77104|nr:PEGA domain-containing protein [Pyxidicoccus xibeiensis]MCP3139044.1 PEGA domain-containing protein [Pyxidicoccus xibeiensis]
MTRTALLLALLLGALPASAQPGASRKVAVLPFQAVSADVPARAGPRVTARLVSEVHATEGLTVATPARAPGEAPPEPPLVTARAAVKEAIAARAARDFPRANAALTRAVEAYAAGAAALTDTAELADAYALRAAVRYATGRDSEAAASLTQALTIAPGRPLPLAESSPLFARMVDNVREAQQAQPRGGVRFDSVPHGLAVTLDGQPVGLAPVRVTGVPPGAHLWRAVLPSGEAVGGVVDVASEREATVTVRPAGTGPEAALALALAGNRVDAAALEAASALGRAAGADLVVFGTVSRAGSGLTLESFVLAPGDKAPRRLPRLSVDVELLEAGTPLRAQVAALAARGVEAGVTEPLPVVPAASTSSPPRVSQVAYPKSPERVRTTEKPAPQQSDRKPLAPVRKPLTRP